MMIDKIYRGASSVAERRKDQVNTLKVFNENVLEIVKDTQYEVKFPCGVHTISMLITLGPDFPIKGPLLKITPVLEHPWISSTGQIIHAPGLVHYSFHSDLGRIVSAIIRELSSSRPVLSNGHHTSPCTSSLDDEEETSPSTTQPSTSVPVPTSMNSSAENTTPSDPQDVVLTELKNLSDDELLKLHQSPSLLDEFINKHFSPASFSEKIEETFNLVCSLAEENLANEPEISTLKEEVDEKFKELKELKAKYDLRNQSYEEACETFKPHKIQESLHESLVEIDERGEQIADDFISLKLCLDRFVTQYIQLRTQFYARKVKDEILAKQLDNLEKAGF